MLAADLGLPVSADSWSTSTIADHTGTTISLTLAGTPLITPQGVYAHTALGAGSSSGIYVAVNTHVIDQAPLPNHAALGAPATAVDLGPGAAPVVDLNGTDPGVDSHATWIFGQGPVVIANPKRMMVVTDPADALLTQARVQISNRPDGILESLTATVSGGITAAYAASTGTLTLTGPATPADFQAVLRTLRYTNYAAYPDAAAREVQVTVCNGALWSAVATSTISLDRTAANAAQRLRIISNPPMEAQAGSQLRWSVQVDTSTLGRVPDLHFAIREAPAGVSLVHDPDASTATITWPIVAGSGHVRFQVLVWDGGTWSGAIQPLCILVRPLPMGVADLTPPAADTEQPADAREHQSGRTWGLLSILCIAMVGIVLGTMARQYGNSKIRPVTEAVRRETEVIRRERECEREQPGASKTALSSRSVTEVIRREVESQAAPDYTPTDHSLESSKSKEDQS
jgi:hypothetical protein